MEFVLKRWTEGVEGDEGNLCSANDDPVKLNALEKSAVVGRDGLFVGEGVLNVP